MTKKLVVLAGGGSAGHVNPLLAVGAALQDRGYEVVALGTKEGLESELVPAAGMRLEIIPKAPIPRRITPEWFTLPGRLAAGKKVAKRTIQGACAVVGFGGYVSSPAYSAAKRLGVPIVIHEQNARPGLANRRGAQSASVVALTFSNTPLAARQGETVVTGLPLRPAVAELAGQRSTEAEKSRLRQSASEKLGLDPDLPTLLVTGGSLGAQRLNEVFAEAMPAAPAGIQVLHLTGKGKSTPEMGGTMPSGARWIVREYLEEMELAFAVADLVVSRSGAGTVSELAALGLPAVFVPLPIGNGEQKLNATDMVEAGGAIVVDNSDFSSAVVQDEIFTRLINPESLAQMSASVEGIGVSDAAQRVADLVEQVCR